MVYHPWYHHHRIIVVILHVTNRPSQSLGDWRLFQHLGHLRYWQRYSLHVVLVLLFSLCLFGYQRSGGIWLRIASVGGGSWQCDIESHTIMAVVVVVVVACH